MKRAAAKKAILVVSYGTSCSDTIEKTIGAIENAIAAAFPDYDVRRAFTSGIIIKKLKERGGIEIDNVTGALEGLAADGYSTVIVQPTHVMNGSEYSRIIRLCAPYKGRFETICLGKPMLTSAEDHEKAVKAAAAETPDMTAENTAVIFVGHGTEHFANAAYAALANRFQTDGYKNTFVVTVKAYPDRADIMTRLARSGVSRVVLLPFMIAAGRHAVKDIYSDREGSWYTELAKAGYEVTVIKKGLGEYKGMQKLFADHVQASIGNIIK